MLHPGGLGWSIIASVWDSAARRVPAPWLNWVDAAAAVASVQLVNCQGPLRGHKDTSHPPHHSLREEKPSDQAFSWSGREPEGPGGPARDADSG